MSDFPFDTFRGIQNGDDATLDDVNVQMITFPDGSTQNQAATPSSQVTGIGYEGTTLTLTQSSGIGDLTTTIPSGGAEVSFMAYWNANTSYASTPLEPYIPSHSTSNVGSPTGYGWDLTAGEFKCHTDTAGLYYFCFNVEMSSSSSVNYLYVQAQKNDADVDIEGFQGGGNSTAEVISTAGVIRLAHNDTFRFVKLSGYPTTIIGHTRSRIFGFRINE